jgi:hypothetical protein
MSQSKVYPRWAYIKDSPLNINLNINSKKQDCKIDTACVGGLVEMRRVKEGD